MGNDATPRRRDAKLERIVEFRTWDDCIAIVADISVRFPDRYHTILNYEFLDDSHSIVITVAPHEAAPHPRTKSPGEYDLTPALPSAQ